MSGVNRLILNNFEKGSKKKDLSALKSALVKGTVEVKDSKKKK